MGQEEARGVDPNSMQIDGSHYQKKSYQVWDFAENNGLGGLEMCIIKYVCRWRDKGNGYIDLQKAIHYVDKLIDLCLNRNRVAKGVASWDDIRHFCRAQNLEMAEEDVVLLISKWDCHENLVECRAVIQGMLDEEANAIANSFDPPIV